MKYNRTNSSYTYDFSVLIDGREVKEYEHGVFPERNTYIEGRRGSNFTLKFRNKSSERVLVVLSVDGLSVMDGKPASDKAGGYICDSYSDIEIPGWKIDSNKIAQFQFQPQGDRSSPTYVEELASEGFDVDPQNQGVIGVMVFKADVPVYVPHVVTNVYHPYPWYHPYPRYWDNIGVMSDSAIMTANMTRGVGTLNFQCSGGDYVGNGLVPASSGFGSLNSSMAAMATPQNVTASLGTAFGEETAFKTSQVEFKRQITPIWTNVIFYDTKSNLQKRGIVFESVNIRTPNAFPASSQNGCYVPKSRR
jgi:hypothetical protein